MQRVRQDGDMEGGGGGGERRKRGRGNMWMKRESSITFCMCRVCTMLYVQGRTLSGVGTLRGLGLVRLNGLVSKYKR